MHRYFAPWARLTPFLLAALTFSCGAVPGNITAGRHLIVHYDADEPADLMAAGDRAVEEIAAELELPLPPGPLKIYLFDSERSLFFFTSRECPDRRGRAAVCWSDTTGFKAALLRQPTDEATLRLLRHEITHYLLASSYTELPPWIDEGLATWFAEPAARRRFEAAAEKAEMLSLIASPPGAQIPPQHYPLAAALMARLKERSGGWTSIRCYLEGITSADRDGTVFERCFQITPGTAAELPLR